MVEPKGREKTRQRTKTKQTAFRMPIETKTPSKKDADTFARFVAGSGLKGVTQEDLLDGYKHKDPVSSYRKWYAYCPPACDFSTKKLLTVAEADGHAFIIESQTESHTVKVRGIFTNVRGKTYLRYFYDFTKGRLKMAVTQKAKKAEAKEAKKTVAAEKKAKVKTLAEAKKEAAVKAREAKAAAKEKAKETKAAAKAAKPKKEKKESKFKRHEVPVFEKIKDVSSKELLKAVEEDFAFRFDYYPRKRMSMTKANGHRTLAIVKELARRANGKQ